MSDLCGNISDYHVYYPEVWDINKPPLSPPNREFHFWGKETKESKQRTQEWKFRLEEYGKNLEANKKINQIKDTIKALLDFSEYSKKKKTALKSEKGPVILNRYELMDMDE